MKNATDIIIESMSKEEYREFKYFIQGRLSSNTNSETLSLLDKIRNDNAPAQNTNALHQTRKRIKKYLEQFALLDNLKQDDFSKILRYVEMAKFLFRKNLYTLAWGYLNKAEEEAKSAEEYRLLDYVYDIQISYSYNIVVPPPGKFSVPDLLINRRKNRLIAEADSNANAAYAHLIHEIRQKLSQKLTLDVDEIKTEIFKEYSISEHSEDNNVRIWQKLVRMICRILREKKDYVALKVYSVDIYYKLKSRAILDKVSKDFYTDLLDDICVACIRAKDYELYEKFISLYADHSKKLHANSQEQTYYDFIPYIDLADLYFVTNRLSEAKIKLNEVYHKYANHTQSARIFCLLRINLMAYNFKIGNMDACIKYYQEMIAYDEKKILNERGFRLEIILYTKLFGILYYYESEDEYYADYLLQQFKRKYSAILKKEDSERERFFIKITEQIMNNPDYLKSKKFEADVHKFTSLKEYLPGDWEYISLNAWLKSKLYRNKSYYECYLEQVRK